MKSLSMILLVCSFYLYADEMQAQNSLSKMTEEQKAALNTRISILKGGEKIVKPGTQRGTVAIVNAQGRASEQWILSAIKYLARETRFNIVCVKGDFDYSSPKAVGDMTIYVIDNPTLPRIVVAPDDRWAFCNVAKLQTDKAPFFEARTKKALSRSFAMLCGGMSSSYAISLVGPMPQVSDLDVLPNEHIPIDVTMRMNQYMGKFGVTPALMKPYKIACEEGWAPPPTNDVQKAIWDKVHAIPDKPITIEFDPKKDK